MTEPPQHAQTPTAFGGPDPTRDIRLPPLTDRPASAMPREWAAMPPEAAGPDFSAPAPELQETEVAPQLESERQPEPMFDEPTDELAPPRGRSRERTIAFASPEMAGGRPTPTVGPTPRRPRRWPWVVLALLPVLVIVVTGAWLFLLLRAA